MRSSYIENNYAEVFEAIIKAFQPINCVELGVLDGYSTIAIAQALQKNGRGELKSYDLFEDYEFKHGDKIEVEAILKKHSIANVSMYQEDAARVHLLYNSDSVDFLHVDLSNTGDTVEHIMRDWDPKMVRGGIICFEGGTEERDQVEWMIKYNARPIKPTIEANEIVLRNYIYGTYLKFPGLTMLLKKR